MWSVFACHVTTLTHLHTHIHYTHTHYRTQRCEHACENALLLCSMCWCSQCWRSSAVHTRYIKCVLYYAYTARAPPRWMISVVWWCAPREMVDIAAHTHKLTPHASAECVVDAHKLLCDAGFFLERHASNMHNGGSERQQEIASSTTIFVSARTRANIDFNREYRVVCTTHSHMIYCSV